MRLLSLGSGLRACNARIVLFASLLSVAAYAGHPDHRLGLRWARQISETRIELFFGASFVVKVARNPKTYRVASPTDPDFQRGVRASGATVKSEEDGPFPEGWEGRRYQRHFLTVELPRPMKPEHRYWVQAMGVDHQPVTGGRAAHWIMPQDAKPPLDAVRNRLGLRSVEIISPNTILLTMGDGVYTKPSVEKPQNVRTVYSTDFEKGVPKTWQAHKEVTEGLPEGNKRAVKAAHLIKWNGSMMVQDYNHGGAFSAAVETGQITFDYFAQNASGVSVRLSTGGSVVLHTIKKPVLGKWTAATLPFSRFHAEKQPSRKAQGPLNVRCLQFVAFKTQTTPALLIDNIKVVTAPPRPAGNIPPHAPSRYVLRSPDDANFRDGQPARRAGRRSRIDCYYTDGWPYGTFKKHEVFLQFDLPLEEGKTYTIDLNEGAEPITCGNPKRELKNSTREAISPAIKVNQLGYLPNAPAKYGYVGAWMGSLGTLDLAFLGQTEFEIRDSETHEVVLKGKPRLRLQHTFTLMPDGSLSPKGAKGKETVYRHDLSYEDVYELDLTALTTEGRYYLAIPGMGRSFTFRVASDVYAEAYRICARGIFHQRCGMEMKAPYTKHYRLACHRNMTELTDLIRTREHDHFSKLPKHVIDEEKHDLFGGHHDAGDYNPRSHRDVVDMLLLAYEVAPKRFTDDQNGIPESGNGIPDILDEAKWGLDLWARLQDEDGGVRNGTESDGDPDMITTAEIDFKRDFAFEKDARASFRFAGTAAQASIIWAGLGERGEAETLLDRAKGAYDYAVQNDGQAYPDDFVHGAIQLYRATGAKRYLDDFHRRSVFAENPNAELQQYQKYDQEFASFYYAWCKRPVNQKLKQAVLSAFKRRMATWVQYAETTGYRYMRHPWAPNTWGTGAYPTWMFTPIEAYALQRDPKYLKWIILTCDFSLGCNPMNTVFTVGLGKRYVTGPLHAYGRYSPEGHIPGIQCEGPSPQTGGKAAAMNMTSWIAAGLYPHGPWPQLHTYTDVEMSPGMNEGITISMAKTALAYGFLMPDWEE